MGDDQVKNIHIVIIFFAITIRRIYL